MDFSGYIRNAAGSYHRPASAAREQLCKACRHAAGTPASAPAAGGIKASRRAEAAPANNFGIDTIDENLAAQASGFCETGSASGVPRPRKPLRRLVTPEALIISRSKQMELPRLS